MSSFGAVCYVAGVGLALRGLMNNKKPLESSFHDFQLPRTHDHNANHYELSAPSTTGISIEPIITAAPSYYKTKKATTSTDDTTQNTPQETSSVQQTTKPVNPPAVGPGCGELKPEQFPIHTGDTKPPHLQSPIVLFADGSDNKSPQHNRAPECNLAKQIIITSNKQPSSEMNIVVHMSKEEENDRLTEVAAHGKSRTKNKKSGIHGTYKDAGYHHINSAGVKSASHKNGQKALDNSIVINKGPRRIGLSKGQIVVLDLTGPGVYHGHVRDWAGINTIPDAPNAMLKAGLVKNVKTGKINWPSN